jgi:hypothetical protein
MYPKLGRLGIAEIYCMGKSSLWVVGVCIQNFAD